VTNETTNLFTGTTEPVTIQPPATTEAPSLLTALVGDTQKYKTPEELAKGYANAEEFINTLKNENAELRKQVTQAKSLDDVLAKLNERGRNQDDNLDTQSPGLNADAIAQIVQQQISGIETAKSRQANLEKADKAMKEKFGERASEVFASAAATPELRDVYTKLAAVDPDKFVSLFSGAAPQQGGTVDTSNVNTASALNASPRVEQWSKDWVTKVRKEDPKKYWSSDFQWQLAQNTSKYFR
jgi:hypothetical protein